MKTFLVKLLTTSAVTLAATTGWAGTAAEAFAKLKGLEGRWAAKHDNHEIEVTYEVISNGSAVLERHMGMVSVYHLDGDSILMTHYCAAKNQPRLRATDFNRADGSLEFKFVDVTSAKPGYGHINHLVMSFPAADRVKGVWTYVNGQESGSEVFDLQRVSKSLASKKAAKNFFGWVEIPASDIERAAKFYSAILGVQLKVTNDPNYNAAMVFLPHHDEGVTGALVKAEGYVPSAQGTLAFIDGGNDLSPMLARVEPAGGKVLVKKTLISKDVGYFAMFLDSEGNRVALYSRN
ncbi:MAG TPA: VOC family protein [Bdellovibrionales bacterium]|nr:VOC family protein [Bdellovibrionales bacterium]